MIINRSEDFAEPVVSAIEALNSEHRRQILIHLEEVGSLPYSEIKRRMKLSKGDLNYHLKELLAAGMIRNFIVDQKVTPYTSYYEVSELGRNVVEGLLGAFRPPVRHMRFTTTANYISDLEISGQATRREREEAPDAASTPTHEPIETIPM